MKTKHIMIVLITCIILVSFFLIIKYKSTTFVKKSLIPGNDVQRYPQIGNFIFISSKEHRTDKFKFIKNNMFIARRGFPFTLINTKLDLNSADVIIKRKQNAHKTAGKGGERKKGGTIDTTGTFKTVLVDTIDISIQSRTKNKIVFTSDVNAHIGDYVIIINGLQLPLFLLFNPYHKEDIVYYPNEKECDEYILNEMGFIFKGSDSNPEYISWDYAQFNEVVFESVRNLLHWADSYSGFNSRDPVSVSRFITYLITNNVVDGFWPTEAETTFRYKEIDGKFVPCDVDSDCAFDPETNTTYNFCKQASHLDYTTFANNEDFSDDKLIKVCGMKFKGTLDDTHTRSDYIPYMNSTQYKVCSKTEDCTVFKCSSDDQCNNGTCKDGACECEPNFYGGDCKLQLPASFSESGYPYEVECLPAKVCGYDSFGGPIPKDKATAVGIDYFKESKSPYTWESSLQIFDIFNNKKIKGIISNRFNKDGKETLSHVLYAQCWVMAALTQTICRLLGIPCRQICCYKAWHEYCPGKGSSISPCYTGIGEFAGAYITKETDVNKPAIATNGALWTYHNWNEVWMKRPDLKNTSYSGSDWQVIDATYQELSEGLAQAGPSPKKAIKENIWGKNNNAGIKYDTTFFSSEVKYSLIRMKGKDPISVEPQSVLVVTSSPKMTFVPNINLSFLDLTTIITESYTGDFGKEKKRSLNYGNTSLVECILNRYKKIELKVTTKKGGKSTISKCDITGYQINYKGEMLGNPTSFSLNTPFSKLIDVESSDYYQFNILVTYPDKTTYYQIKQVFMNPNSVTLSFNKKSKDITVKIKNPLIDKPFTNIKLELNHDKTIDYINLKDISPGETLSYSKKINSSGIVSARVFVSQFKTAMNSVLVVKM
jgi:hypothetical protein